MTIEELRKEIIKVEVKAKQHSYLLQPAGLNSVQVADQPQQQSLGLLVQPPPKTALFEGFTS